MKLNTKWTGGLAWAGLVIILAVPSAEMLAKTAEGERAAPGDSANAVPESMPAAMVDEEKAAVAPPIVTPTLSVAAPADPPAPAEDVVEDYLASGKALPSYISDGAHVPDGTDAEVAAVGADGVFIDDIETAAIPDAAQPVVAPQPYPVSKRPTQVAAVDSAPVLIIDEPTTLPPIASREREPFISSEQLEEWDSGSLADYLERRGLLANGGGATPPPAESNYDPDGFFLDEGPNAGRRLVGREPRGEFFFF